MTETKSTLSTPPQAAGEKRTLVEEGTHFRGSMTSTCPVLVRGAIEGEVAAPSLTVSPSGAVSGKAKVNELRSQGEISGEFDADTVQLSGRVRDKTVIRTKSLEVNLTPTNGKLEVMFGECDLEVGDAPVLAPIDARPKLSSVPPARASTPPPAKGSIPPAASS